ncbi:hypothetical protein EFB08_22440 [Rufibacter latericius]|uniref:Uncharacterized protein n=1 Tax=Rufibacter latericius TaxID=2487040 RepID=A0A3M9M8U8_9BACT|nr:hypothetical protein EFB08_22440 [Rufibacter latericius]
MIIPFEEPTALAKSEDNHKGLALRNAIAKISPGSHPLPPSNGAKNSKLLLQAFQEDSNERASFPLLQV